MSAPNVLPSALTREQHDRVFHNGEWWVPCYCVNCGARHGRTIEPTPGDRRFVSYICLKCAEKCSPEIRAMLVPDQVHAAIVEAELREKYGQSGPTDLDIVKALDDPNSVESKLLKLFGA